MSDAFAPESCHRRLLADPPRKLRFRPDADFAAWRAEMDAKLRELIGWLPERAPLDIRIEDQTQTDAFDETRFVFAAEPGADVPCHLLIPRGAAGPVPVVICLQGHSTGMHISLGRPKYDGDEKSIAGDRDFGLQAVRQGYAALVMEQRCFGERKDARENAGRHDCTHPSMVSLLLGRTMIGERCWDVSRGIDALEEAFADRLDLSRIGCMGNSGGGTVTWFASCLEGRIAAAMPSCYVCTFADSIGSINHCPDNYIPGALQWFEMADLAGLIAPRPLVVVAGTEDPIFPFPAVQRTYETIAAIYAAAGAPDNCRLVIGQGGHRFYATDGWARFAERTGWQA